MGLFRNALRQRPFCAAQTRVVTCGSCGNHVHQECFQQWSAQKKASMQASGAP